VIAHIVLYFLAGFCIYYWESNGRKMDWILLAYQLALFIGGIYLVGWGAILTILLSYATAPLFLYNREK
jgi:hypothetical protein